MVKTVLAAASYYKKSYYFNEEFTSIPESVKKEMKALLGIAAEKTQGIICIGFYENGSVFIETSKESDDFDYDEINAKEITKAIIAEKGELLNGLRLWYSVFKTPRGEKIRSEILKKHERGE